jgi:hypothetical protein
MSESRVARWRARLKKEGKKAVTVWLSAEEELRLKDLAATWYCPPSEVMQRALAQFHPGRPPRLGNDTETTQSHHETITDTTQIRAILHAELPGMVQALVEQYHREPRVTETRSSGGTETPAPTQPPSRAGGRPRGRMTQAILALLADHPEGLTAEQIRATLNPDKPIGDNLQGMRRRGVIQVVGSGRQRRYVQKLPSSPPTRH